MQNLKPVTLTGRLVRLEPLELGHVAQLAAVGLEPELWTLQPKAISSAQDMRSHVEEALEDQRRGALLPFAIVELRSRAIIGSTRYMDIALAHRRLEGTFRQQFISESGRSRDMVYSALFADRWTELKAGLQKRLDRHRASP